MFNNFSKINHKKVKVRNQDDNLSFRQDKKGKKKKDKHYKPGQRKISGSSEGDFDSGYNFLDLHEPEIRRRISRSIDNSSEVR